MKKQVCILTTGHSALSARIFHKEAKSLHKAGYEVTVIAPLNDDGFLTDTANQPFARNKTVLGGITIIGFKKVYGIISGLPKIRTALEWFRQFTAGRLRIGKEFYSDMIEKGIKLDADIYHCHEIESLYVGIQIKLLLKKKNKYPKLIFDVHEFWSAKHSNGLIAKLKSKIVAHFERTSLKYVDYIITANYITRGHLFSLNRFIKIEVLDNCPVLSIFKNYGYRNHDKMITICHEGMLRFNRGLKEMLEVMKILKERYIDNIKLLIIGDVFGEEKIYFEKTIKEYEIENIVERTGWLPYEKVGEAISNCSIGIIFMELTENNMLAGPPNKLYNYMRYGLPVVTVDLPETRRIVLESQCGIVVKKRTVSNFVESLSSLINDASLRQRLGENGAKAIREQYHWEKMEKKLLRVYNELTSSSDLLLHAEKSISEN